MSIRLRALVAALALAPALAVAQTPAPAADAGSGLRFLLGVSLTGGGDTLATVRFTDGSSQNISSGGFVQLFGGAEYDTGSVVVQGTLGYHVDDTSASNGSVKFARYPAELLGLAKLGENWRLGGGLRKALNARVTSSGAARGSIGGLEFDSELGFVLQLERHFGPGSVFGRVVAEKYTVGREKVDGNHIGVGVAYRF
jgi:hypothetical protein